MAKPAKSAAQKRKELIDDQEFVSQKEKEEAKAKVDAQEKAAQAKANKEKDLIGAKDSAKLNTKTETKTAAKTEDVITLPKREEQKTSSSAADRAKSSSSVKNKTASEAKQTVYESASKKAGAQSGLDKIETAKREKAAAQAKANKEKDLPGFDGHAAQKAFEQQKAAERIEYLNVKEARDKKSVLEQELAEAKAQAKAETEKAGTVQIVSHGIKGKQNDFVLPETQKRIDELEKQISDLNKNINLASRKQESKYLYNSALKAEDFDEYSKEPEKEEKVINPHQQNIKRETETVKAFMTEDEKAVYNYYYNKFGKEKAEEYFDSIREELNQRQAQAIFSGNEGKVLNEYIQGAAAGLENSKEGYQSFLNMILGIEEPQPTSTMDFVSQMAREDLENSGFKLPEALGGASLGQIGFDAINTTVNMLPSVMLGTLGGAGIGAVAIGASAAGNAYNSAITEGYSKEQATNYAALVGASEAALGYVLGGIEATGGKLGKAALAKVLPKIDNALAKAAVNVGGKMLSEFSEEYLQEVLSPVFENIALLEENEIDLLSPEAIYSGILGALSAGGIALLDGSANVPEALQKAEVPVPFDGTAQPGTEAGIVAEKITEIENSSSTESEKAERLERVIEKVAKITGNPEVIAEAERIKNYHTERQAEFNEAVDVGKKLGVSVEFDSNIAGNGVHTSDGRIIINPNTENPALQVFVHELTHDIETSGLYGAFSEKILGHIKELGYDVNKIREQVKADYEAAGHNLTDPQLDAEVVAKYCEQHLFTDEKAIQRLCDTEPTIFQRIKNWISDMIVKFKGTAEERFLLEAERLYEKALATRGEVSGIDSESVGRGFDKLVMDSAEIQTIQNIGRKSVNDFTTQDIKNTERFAKTYWHEMGQKSPFFRAWFGDWRANDQTPVQIANQQGNATGVIKNNDTGWDIQVSSKVFGETKAHTDSYNIAARAYLPYIDDITKKAVLLDSFAMDPNKPKSPNSLLMHSMYAVADIGKGPEVLKLYVEEMYDPNKPKTTKRDYQLQNIEKYRLTGMGSQNVVSPISPANGIEYTVADIFDYVKAYDLSFVPKEASKVVNPDGTPKVVYHGTEEDFTVFDRTKGRANMDIQGLFFSPYKEEAADYGEKVGAYYLNIKNPADSTTAYKAFEMFKGQNEAGVKAREYLENLGYDGVINDSDEFIAFYPEQIKSATDNIGTFDPQNPDYRYSTGRGFDEIAENAEYEDTVPSFVRADINRIVDDPSITNEQKFFDLMALYDSAKTPAEKSEIGRYIYQMKTIPTERKPFFGIKNRANSSAKNSAEQNATFVPEREIKTPEGISLLQEEVETNIGKMPVEDYREILAAQNGFNSYEEMQAEARAMEEWDRKEEEWRKEQAEAQMKEIIREGRSRRFVREETKAEPGTSEFVSAEISDSAKRVLEQMAPKTEKQSTISQVNLESESTNLVDVPQSEKSKRIERRYQRAVEEGVASVFGIDRKDIREDIRPILEEIGADVKDGKKITDEQIEELYNKAFESGYITEEFPQYEETRKYIRSTPIFVDGVTRREFGDDFEFRDFARSNFGSIKISTDPRSRHIDDFYKTLSEMDPEFFDAEETDPRTQLENIADFMQQTKKQYYGLSEVYSGTELSEFKDWAKKELRAYMDEFGKGLDNVRRYERDRQIKATNKAREIDRTASFEQAKAAFEGNRVFEAQKAMEKAKANALLNDNDLLTVKRLHEGTLNEADVLALGGNVEGILEVYKTEKTYRQARAPFDRYKAAYKTALQHDAVQLTELSDEWTDKKIGFAYSRETAERNIRDIAGKGGERVISEYFEPVHENEAMKIRWIKEMNQRVADLELGKMNRYERAYAQMIGENAAYIAEGKLTKHNQAEHDALNERISVLLREHGKKIDKAKCEKAAAGFMDIYKDIREEWNNERIRRGQEPVGEIENYFPHFVETKPESLLQKFFSLFGFDISSSKLPTDIAGRTADRKPNSKYNPHANRRTSDVTDYDILKGFDGYVRAVGDNIYHTEDIQKLRALSDTIRTKYSSAETEKRIEEIRNREDLSEADKEALIADVFKADPGAYHLSNFVVWLDEYTNILAGKKSRGDREAEYQMGREIYDVSKALEGRIASNMIGFNLSTPVMNFVPMFQATADVSPVDIVSSFMQTGVAALKGDSFISDNSDFLTNRFGADSVYKKNYNLFSAENMKDFVAKVSDGGGLLMEYVDRIVSESLVRARYEQNIKKGLDKVTAFSEADQWAAGLIADRSLGALPTVFNIKNPVAKAVTMFQVEANNQYSYIFKDAGKYKAQKEGMFNTIAGQLAFWAAMAICNGLADELLGRDNVVPDSIGMTADAIEKIQNGEKVGDVALDTATNVVEQIPFVGGLLGGGRVPISTALPDFEQSLKLLNPETSPEKKQQILIDELTKPFTYILLPSGAGQLWKTGKGVQQLIEGGAYGMESDGSEYMKFPQEYDPESVIKTVLFGQYASDRGQEYIDSNFKSLSAKDTANMKLAEEYGLSKQEFYDTILGLREFDKKEEKQEAILQNENLDAREKGVIDWILFGDQKNFPESTRNYSSEDAFYRSGLETGELRLYEDGYGREEIDKIETALEKGGTKVEDVAAIQKALGCTEAEAFEIYQRRNGKWIDDAQKLTSEEKERASGAAGLYGMSAEDYLTVLNYSSFGTVVEGEYSNKMEDVIPKIMEATGWDRETATNNYNMVNKFDYSRNDLGDEQKFDLTTSQSWYEVDDKGYFVARNVIKTTSGTADEYGNTISGSKKEAAVKEIAKQLNIDEAEATIYYLAANGDLVLSADDLSSSQREDMEAALKEGWTVRGYIDAVNVLKVTGATKKEDILKDLQDAGASYSMAQGYYNLRQNKDYDRFVGKVTYKYGMKNEKQEMKGDYFLEHYGKGEVTDKDITKWFAAAEGCKKKQEYIDAYMGAGATYSQALEFYNLIKGYNKTFNAWYKENGGN